MNMNFKGVIHFHPQSCDALYLISLLFLHASWATLLTDFYLSVLFWLPPFHWISIFTTTHPPTHRAFNSDNFKLLLYSTPSAFLLQDLRMSKTRRSQRLRNVISLYECKSSARHKQSTSAVIMLLWLSNVWILWGINYCAPARQLSHCGKLG